MKIILSQERIFKPFLLQAGRPSIFFLRGEFINI